MRRLSSTILKRKISHESHSGKKKMREESTYECSLCGNTGVVVSGDFCKCPHGCELRSTTHYSDYAVLLDVGPLVVGSDGDVQMPRMKLGIQSQYVFVAPGLCKSGHPDWTHTCTACAATGPSPDAILKQVQPNMSALTPAGMTELYNSWSKVLPLAAAALNLDAKDLGYEIRRSETTKSSLVAEKLGILELGISEQTRQRPVSSQLLSCESCDGIAYNFSSGSGIDAAKFFSWLDFAGYAMVARQTQGGGLQMRAGFNNTSHIVRVALYQPSIDTGFDVIMDFGRPMRDRTTYQTPEPERAELNVSVPNEKCCAPEQTDCSESESPDQDEGQLRTEMTEEWHAGYQDDMDEYRSENYPLYAGYGASLGERHASYEAL